MATQYPPWVVPPDVDPSQDPNASYLLNGRPPLTGQDLNGPYTPPWQQGMPAAQAAPPPVDSSLEGSPDYQFQHPQGVGPVKPFAGNPLATPPWQTETDHDVIKDASSDNTETEAEKQQRASAEAAGNGDSYDLLKRQQGGMQLGINSDQQYKDARDQAAKDATLFEANQNAIRKKSEDDLNAAAQINPGRWWANKSTGGKVAAAIGAFLGGWLGEQNGTHQNAFMNQVNKIIGEDIDAQKTNFANKNTVHQQLVSRLGNEQAAFYAHQASALQDIKDQAVIEAKKYDLETQKTMLPVLLKQLDQAQRQAQSNALKAQDDHLNSLAGQTDKGVRKSNPGDFIYGKDGKPIALKKGLQIIENGPAGIMVYDPALRLTPREFAPGKAAPPHRTFGGGGQ